MNTIALTRGQKKAADVFEDALVGSFTTQMILKGYAGTGKTTLLQHITGGVDAVLIAPTHKALAAARAAGWKKGVRTLASLLGKKKQRAGNGEYRWVYGDEFFSKKRLTEMFKPSSRKRVLVVDEASMISAADYAALMPLLQGIITAVLFVGDPRQLPPVEADPVDFMAEGAEPEINEVFLNEVVRNDGAILELATEIREMPFGLPIFKGKEGPNLEVLRNSDWWNAAWLEKTGDVGGVHALAYTNKRVDELNRIAVLRFHGYDLDTEERRYRVEQVLLTVEGTDTQESTRPIPSTTEIRVTNARYRTCELPAFEDSNVPALVVQECELEVELVSDPGETETLLVLAGNKDEAAVEQRLKLLKKAALAATPAERSQRWQRYYGLIEGYDKVRHAYALTIHKAQGSTYDHVFLDAADISAKSKRDLVLANRLAYVGVSRASKSLTILY
jgi:exodeoxyribonuclease-5